MTSTSVSHDGGTRARTEWVRCPARDGFDTLIARAHGRELPIYSRVAPRKQAARQVVEQKLWECDVLVCIGLGLGHHLEALVDYCAREKLECPQLLAIEPDLGVLELWSADGALSKFRRDHLERIWSLNPDHPDFSEISADLSARVGVRIRAFVLPHLQEFDPNLRSVVEAVLASLADRPVSEPPAMSTEFDAWIAMGNPLQAYAVAKRDCREDLKTRATNEWVTQYAELRATFETNSAALRSGHLVGSGVEAFEFTGHVEEDLERCGNFAWSRSKEGMSLLVRVEGRWKRLNYGQPPEALTALAQELQPLIWDDVLDFDWLEWFHQRRPEQFLDMRPTVYVVIQSREAFRIALHLTEASEVLSYTDYYWLVGPQAESQLRDLLVRRPRLLPPTKHFQVEAVRSASPLEWESIAIQVAWIRESRYRRDMELAADYYRGVETKGWPQLTQVGTSPSRPTRVLLVTSRFTTVLQYTVADLSVAFAEIGCQVQILMESCGTERLTHYEYATRIAHFKPDLIVQIDSFRPHFPWVDPRIPYVGWVQDRLPRLFERGFVSELGDRDIALAMFPALAQQCRDSGYPKVGLLPVAVNSTRYSTTSATIDSPSEYDIVLVSNVSKPSLPNLVWAVEQYCREHGYGWGDPQHYSELFDWLTTHRNLKVPEGSRSAFEFQLYVEFERYLQRTEAVRWAIQGGYRVGLFGEGWESSDEFSPHARGWVRPGEPLRELYRSAGCHLQINLDTNVHSRVFECLAAGGVVVARAHPTDEQPGGLGDYLELGTEILTFASAEELSAIVERLTEDPSWREQVARAGQQRVLRDHTYRHRAREILECASQRMRDTLSLTGEKGLS